MRRFVVVAIVVTLAACGSSGGDSGTAEGKKYVAAIEARYRTGTSRTIFTQDQARCLAEKIVDAVTVAKFKDAGVSPSDIATPGSFATVGRALSRARAQALGEVFTGGDCIDFGDVVLKAMARSSSIGALSNPRARCLVRRLLSNASFKQAMVDTILGRDSSGTAVGDALKNDPQIFRYLADCKIKPSELTG